MLKDGEPFGDIKVYG